MDATSLGVIVTTLGTVIVAYIGYLGTRDKKTRRIAERAESNIEELREQVDESRKRLDVAMAHIYALRDFIRENGLMLPPLPPELNWQRNGIHHHKKAKADD